MGHFSISVVRQSAGVMARSRTDLIKPMNKTRTHINTISQSMFYQINRNNIEQNIYLPVASIFGEMNNKFFDENNNIFRIYIFSHLSGNIVYI